MDKVRAFMRVVWVQRFWVLSVVGVLAALVCWMLAAGKLQAEYASEKAAILAKFGEMDAIRNKPFHGNDPVNAKEREEASKIAQNVQSLWQRLYEHQRKEVLYWPEKDLGKQFVEEVEKKKFDAPISNAMRDRYLNYIQKRFDALIEIVDAQKMMDGTAQFSGEGRGETATYNPAARPGEPGYVEDFLVQWLDQGALQTKLLFASRPTSRAIWVRQEDLWVYETLLKVIADTNKERGATRPDNTAIRTIEALQVGAEAASAAGRESQILLPAGAVSGDVGAEDMARESAPMDYRGEGMDGGGDAAAADAALLSYRYIDNDGKAIPDASTGMGAEFRRLPVRMRLMMDARWIPKLLVECANAPLPVEVQRLRINPEQSGVGFDMGSVGGGGEGGMYRGGMGEGGGRGYMGEGSYTPSATGAPTADLVTVEVIGFVYIYNAPDPTVLTVPGGEDLAAVDAAVVK